MHFFEGATVNRSFLSFSCLLNQQYKYVTRLPTQKRNATVIIDSIQFHYKITTLINEDIQ